MGGEFSGGPACRQRIVSAMPRLTRSSRPGLARTFRGLLGVAALLALLEALTRAELVNPTYLPPASTVLATTARILTEPDFLRAVGGTLIAWMIGMLIAT